MTTLKTLCTTVPKVRMTLEYNPELLSQASWDGAQHAWKVTLKYKTRQLSVPFFGGSSVVDVEAHDVLDCLLLDASCSEETGDFRSWCEYFGLQPDEMYDHELAKHMKSWKAAAKNARKVKRLLGEDYDLFLYSDRD